MVGRRLGPYRAHPARTSAYRQAMHQPTTVAAVVARMEAIASPLPRADGIACFTRLYLAVTKGVQAHLTGTVFEDPRFLDRLDVAFADLFFDALDAFQSDPATTPHAWLPLFQSRSERGIAPLQFALAGMNAHINRDLPVALVATCRELGVALEEDSPQHHDFETVNTLLASTETQVKQQYVTGWLRRIDRLVHRVDRIDDIVAMWDVGRARDAAWTNGEALWAIRDDAALAQAYLDSLDRMVGFAGRGLLVPADTWLQRLGRAFR
jgi:Family of unknown function (DUF5995)